MWNTVLMHRAMSSLAILVHEIFSDHDPTIVLETAARLQYLAEWEEICPERVCIENSGNFGRSFIRLRKCKSALDLEGLQTVVHELCATGFSVQCDTPLHSYMQVHHLSSIKS
jgi:hypothetical protein